MLLRRVTENVKEQNWFAVGIDFIIVVIGVFIGLQVQNWSEQRNDKMRAELILEQIQTSLEADLSAVEQELERFQLIDLRLGSMIEHVSERRPFDPSLEEAFGLMYGFRQLNLDRAAYESLKSEGLDLIKDNVLRTQIAAVYEKTYQQLDRSMSSEQEVVLYLRPYFLENFRDLRFTQSATPIDYEALIGDARFENLAAYRLQAVRANQLQNLTRARMEMSALIGALGEAR